MSLSAVKSTLIWLFVILLTCGLAEEDSNKSQALLVDSKDHAGDGRGAIARQKCIEYSQYASASKCPTSIIGNEQPVNVSGSLGKTRAELMEFPHMAVLGHQSEGGLIRWYCGGAVISETFVLTSASCANSIAGGDIWVRVGDLNLDKSDDGAMPEERRVTERIPHPEHKPHLAYHDIALLRLESPVSFNNWIRPACLHTIPSVGTQEAIATGWGRLEPSGGKISPDLMKVTLPLVDSQTCKADWPAKPEGMLSKGIIEDWLICAGAKGKDTCQGDAGGPLAIRRIGKEKELCMYDVIGVTSLGKSCGSGLPALYTRVYNYVPWIESKVWGRG